MGGEIVGGVGARRYQRTEGCSFIVIPCGKCIGCRMVRVRAWAIRCMHEAQMHDTSCFITLTYDDDHYGGPSLNYVDFQQFMYRLRKRLGPTRFYMCGEY